MAQQYDVAIVGGGPAGLSAALILGRSQRLVIVLDHQKPRNYAAHPVHSFLGLDGVEPAKFSRKRGQARFWHTRIVFGRGCRRRRAIRDSCCGRRRNCCNRDQRRNYRRGLWVAANTSFIAIAITESRTTRTGFAMIIGFHSV
jgi:glycine/D-amino acid oxidase-like deaminating enzyme